MERVRDIAEWPDYCQCPVAPPLALLVSSFLFFLLSFLFSLLFPTPLSFAVVPLFSPPLFLSFLRVPRREHNCARQRYVLTRAGAVVLGVTGDIKG